MWITKRPLDGEIEKHETKQDALDHIKSELAFINATGDSYTEEDFDLQEEDK